MVDEMNDLEKAFFKAVVERAKCRNGGDKCDLKVNCTDIDEINKYLRVSERAELLLDQKLGDRFYATFVFVNPDSGMKYVVDIGDDVDFERDRDIVHYNHAEMVMRFSEKEVLDDKRDCVGEVLAAIDFRECEKNKIRMAYTFFGAACNIAEVTMDDFCDGELIDTFIENRAVKTYLYPCDYKLYDKLPGMIKKEGGD